jgi:hypothetical protein
MLLSRSVVVPSNETREKQVQVELEDDENGLFLYCKLMRTKWNLVMKIKSELSGKKWDKAMKNSSLGMTEVIVVENEGLSLERVALQYKYSYRKELN